MPESSSSIPPSIRGRLSGYEQNVLIYGARGGPEMIWREMPTIDSEREAAAALERVKEKVERLVADARRPESNGDRRVPVVLSPDAPPQPERGATLPRMPMPTMPKPARRPGPRRERGELLRDALRELADEGPMKQSELRDRLGIDSPTMSGVLKPKLLAAGVVEGERVDRSPMLSYSGPVESQSEGGELQSDAPELHSATETGTDTPADEPPPSVTPQFVALVREARDAFGAAAQAMDRLLAGIEEQCRAG